MIHRLPHAHHVGAAHEEAEYFKIDRFEVDRAERVVDGVEEHIRMVFEDDLLDESEFVECSRYLVGGDEFVVIIHFLEMVNVIEKLVCVG